jgi:hypothetical protein
MWTQTERSTEYVLFLKTLLERMKTVGLGSDLLHGCADLTVASTRLPRWPPHQ